MFVVVVFQCYCSIFSDVVVEAPLDKVPLFALAGSIIPIADPRIMTLNNATNSSVVTWESLKVNGN